MQVRESDLKQALNPLSAPRNPSVQTAKSSAPSPSGATSAPRKTLFKNVPAWSFLNSLPTQTPTPTNQAKTNNDATHNSSKDASRELNEPTVRPSMVPSRCMSRGSSEREPKDGSVVGGCPIGRGNSQENPIIIDDGGDGDPTDRSSHTSHQMTVDNPDLRGGNTDGDAGGAAHTGEIVANSDLDDAAMLQCENRSTIATSTSFSLEIPESDSGATLNEESQLHSPLREDPIANPCGKRSRSLSGSDRADGRGNDWVFNVFAEDDSETEGHESPSSKRARPSSRPLEAAENGTLPTVVVKDVQMSGSAHGDRPLRGDQEYPVHEVVGTRDRTIKSPFSQSCGCSRRRWTPS